MNSNKKKLAMITGINGQDGSYLAEYLLNLGYVVHGTVRTGSNLDRIAGIRSRLILHPLELDNFAQVEELLKTIVPDEFYHLAAKSFVSYSFDDEFNIMNTNTSGTHHLLSCLYLSAPKCRFYFAGTSEIFGQVESEPQNEKTSYNPRSIYGISKLVGLQLAKYYRESKNLFSCTGILYNHESPRRGEEYVTRKITSTAVKIKLGLTKELRLGNIDAMRDWGSAKEYVVTMHKMLQLNDPEDFVIGTGKLHSVKDFLQVAFSALDLNYQDFVVIDEKYFRPAEKHHLVADAKKAQDKMNLKLTTSFEQIVEEMVESDYNYFKAKI